MDAFDVVDAADVVEINNRRTENGERRTCCGLYYGYSVWYNSDFAFWTAIPAKSFGYCVGGCDEVCCCFGQFFPFGKLAANDKSSSADRGEERNIWQPFQTLPNFAVSFLAVSFQNRIPKQSCWCVAQVAFQAVAVVGRDAADFIVGVEQGSGRTDEAAVMGGDNARDAELLAKTCRH